MKTGHGSKPIRLRKASSQAAIRRYQLSDQREDTLLVEAPLVMRINGQELVTMRTPGADEELARGFLFSESIISRNEEILEMESTKLGEVELLKIQLQTQQAQFKGRLSRVHEIRASCGLCGVPDIERLSQHLPMLKPAFPKIRLADLEQWFAGMAREQELFKQTGGSHAAALIHEGRLMCVAEDVGRHNAVDKVIGAAMARKFPLNESVLLLSGRSGFELVLKAVHVAIPIIASVSAPSSMALELAEEVGATLIGFVRGASFRIYCDEHRLIASDSQASKLRRKPT